MTVPTESFMKSSVVNDARTMPSMRTDPAKRIRPLLKSSTVPFPRILVRSLLWASTPCCVTKSLSRAEKKPASSDEPKAG